MKSIDDLRKQIETQTNQIKENLDSDSFTSWKQHPVTKLFFDDIQLVILDRMMQITANQPHTEQHERMQAMDRGYVKCLIELYEWNPIETEDAE